ncbi:unnamed protein product, partial [Phaeothamnion confervicola]
ALAAPVAVFCRQCGDAFCKPCFDASHARGRRREHALIDATPIPMCGVCSYQHAARLCETSSKPKGFFCDVCFFNAHPDIEANRRELQGVELCVSSSPAKKQATAFTADGAGGSGGAAHKSKALVVPCVSCKSYAARWRCDDCADVFCRRCFAALHAHGNSQLHSVEPLPYYTV